jgi:hypothetical protein
MGGMSSRGFGHAAHGLIVMENPPVHDECFKRAVLVIEDNVPLSEFMCEFIANIGIYDVCVAHTCEEARRLFVPGKYFVVILDLDLNGSIDHGIELAIEFRESDDNVFIAVITGHYPIYDSRLIDTVDELLGKPINNACLQSKLFMWSVQYNRRLALKCYFDDKMAIYSMELADIRGLELSIKERMAKLAASLGLSSEGDVPNGSASG